VQIVKFRLCEPRLAPRRTKIEVPGWPVSRNRGRTARTNTAGIACHLWKARIYDSRETLARDSTWTSSTRTAFDGTYRNIFRAARAKAKSDEAGS
jgi:hypothetical protein